ncbi:MAG: hypothetical protein KGS72_10970 [Cyanobacteria bacterium REEB67]|nr:hypothetical protein [Cyanobacteria bacterium REEB67]
MRRRAMPAKAKGLAIVVVLVLPFFSIPGAAIAAPAAPPNSAASRTGDNKSLNKQSSIDGYRLWQNTELWGDSIVSIAPEALRVENPKTGVNMLISKPYKTIYLYNTQTKSICQSPFKIFRCPLAKTFELFTSFHVDEVPMMPDGDQKILNLPAKKYKSSKAFSARQFRLRETDHIPNSNAQTLESANTDYFKLAPVLEQALSRFYNLPVSPGLPLWARIENLNKEHTITLTTLKEVKLKLDSATFAVPIGYKTMKNGAEIIRSDMSPESMELF